jgi:hypothetical protein
MTANEKLGLVRRFVSWARDHSRSTFIAAALLVQALWAVRGYVPALGSASLFPPGAG